MKATGGDLWLRAAGALALICALAMVGTVSAFELRFGHSAAYREIPKPLHWTQWDKVAEFDGSSDKGQTSDGTTSYPLGAFWLSFGIGTHEYGLSDRLVGGVFGAQLTTYEAVAHLRIGRSLDDPEALPISRQAPEPSSKYRLGRMALRKSPDGHAFVLTERQPPSGDGPESSPDAFLQTERYPPKRDGPEAALFAFSNVSQRQWAPLPLGPSIAWSALALTGALAMVSARRHARSKTSDEAIGRKVEDWAQIAALSFFLASGATVGFFLF